MAEPTAYRSQVAPGGPQRAVLTRPEDFGAGLADAVGRGGEQLHSIQLRQYKLDRQEQADAQAADFGRRFAEYRIAMDDVARTARSETAPGAKGHAEAIEKKAKEDAERLLDGLTEDSLRQSAKNQLDEYFVRLVKGEKDFEEGRRINKLVTDIGVSSDTGANRVRTSGGDDEIYGEELTLQRAAINAAPGLSADEKAALVREAEQKLTIGYLQGLSDKSPEIAKAKIDAGEFNDIFTPGQLDQLRNGAEVEIRRIDAQRERELAQAKAALNERIQSVKELDSQGVEIPDEALVELEAAATSVGDISTATQLRGIRANNTFAKVWGKATPVQREQRLAGLRAKANPSEAEQREIAWLESKSGALDSSYNKDPYGAAAAALPGSPPPAIDFANPQSLQARVAWQRSVSKTMGRPVPIFSPNEEALYREQYEAGDGQRMALLRQLDSFGNKGTAKADAARQIAPGDKHFQILAQLQPSARSMVAEGKKALAGRKGFFATDDPDVDAMVARYNQHLAYAMRRIGGSDAVQNIAVQFAAGALAREGVDGNSLREGTYKTAIRVALGGGAGGTGGLGYWNGKHPFILSDGFTDSAFQMAVVTDLVRQAKNPPVNPDGSPADLKRAIPVIIAPGRYQWETPSRQLVMAKNGSPFVSVVAQ